MVVHVTYYGSYYTKICHIMIFYVTNSGNILVCYIYMSYICNMSNKKIYYEKETVTTVKEKGFIEIDMNYTQLYNCFNKVSLNINAAMSFKLLFWILANKSNDSNGIDTSVVSFNEFNKHLADHCGEDCIISYRTFLRSIGELKDSGAFTQVQKGHYYANPNMFWQGPVEERSKLLIEEAKDGNTISVNP